MRSLFRLKLKDFGKRLGPGIITGAADDDPSGILTHLIAGAQTGLSLIWAPLLTIPLMAGVQEMCARIGLVTKRGLVGNMKLHTPKAILFLVAILMLVFSFSKLLHAPGLFFSPTRYQVDNPREKRYLSAWAAKLETQKAE